MRQIPLAIGIEAARTFENFLPGANAIAIAHLEALAPEAAPVYLWGASGSGKTHLMQALAHRHADRGVLAGWFNAGDAAPWAFDDSWSLVVIDDCDALDSEQQHAAFALFVEAATRGIPVVAAGRVPPVDLPLREDLRTRLGWGHVFAIRPLGEPEVRATLRRVADHRGIFLSDEVMGFLLTRFARDLKHLMLQLDRLDEFSLATKRVITVPMMKQMLAEEAASVPATNRPIGGSGSSATTPGQSGARPAAVRNLCLFDLDETLLPLDSDHAWGDFIVRLGWVDEAAFRRRNDAFFAQYQAGTLDIHEYVAFATEPLRERSAEEADAAHRRFMREVIEPVLHPAALALVRGHADRGDTIALVTATNDFVTAPIARALGIADLIAVRLERDADGRVTGRIDGTPSYREGKVARVQEWLTQRGDQWEEFERISVYSDSTNDLPLLERATDPVATNPSAALRQIADARGWRTLHLFE